MKRTLLWIVAAAFLLSVSSAFGQNTDITFKDSLSTYGNNYGNDRTGLYGATINNQNTQMICDDFYHSISDGQEWKANGINAANLNASNIGMTQFGAGGGLQLYTELAFLVSQMYANSSSPANMSLVSQAIWNLTTPSAAPANSYTALALAFFNTYGVAGLKQFANLWVYTPVDQSSGGPQEMWGQIPVPEGGAALIYLLLAGVACFGAMFLSRSRTTKAGLA